jgi:hypothetical protein
VAVYSFLSNSSSVHLRCISMGVSRQGVAVRAWVEDE